MPAAGIAAAAELELIAAWNRAGRLPVRNGFSRRLPQPSRVRFDPSLIEGVVSAVAHQGGLLLRTAADTLVWGVELEVEGASRLRLHLAEVELPAAALLWVSGERRRVGPFGLELRGPDGGVWTPSVEGEVIRLEVEVPVGGLSGGGEIGLAIDRVMEIVALDEQGAPVSSAALAERRQECLCDAACIETSEFPNAGLVEAATARLEFVRGGGSFLCTGALLSDTDPSSFVPFLLTANHCISTANEALSLEAFWDFLSSACGGPPPSLSQLERSNGSTLLATGSSSDYTLLQLSSVPAGRAYLGWDADPDAASDGTLLHRISHSLGRPQQYSRSRVDGSFPICTGAPLSRFVYGFVLKGGTFGGGSGAPIVNALAQVLGQLFGGCGPTNPEDGCDRENAEVDGAFSASFPSLAPFLTGGGCVESATVLCLRDGRFRAEMSWRDRHGNQGAGIVVPGVSTNESGLFYFFSEANWEMLLKVLDGCSLNGHFWVYYAATTDVELTLTVTDTQTGTVERYHNPLGQPARAGTDSSAFATCP